MAIVDQQLLYRDAMPRLLKENLCRPQNRRIKQQADKRQS